MHKNSYDEGQSKVTKVAIELPNETKKREIIITDYLISDTAEIK